MVMKCVLGNWVMLKKLLLGRVVLWLLLLVLVLVRFIVMLNFDVLRCVVL